MAVPEARMVLNLKEAEYTKVDVEKTFEKMFLSNDVEKGGSFYLQSKIYRARESLLEEMGEEYTEPEILVEKEKIESNENDETKKTEETEDIKKDNKS
jgi:hypothetical protein